MKRFFVIAVVLFTATIAMAQGGGGGGGGGTSSFKPATADAWFRVLDTTFYWGQLKLSELNVPATLTRPHLRRAWALGLAYAGVNESYDVQIQNWMVRDHLLGLFFHDLYPIESQPPPVSYGELWYAVNNRLRERYGINLDSVEALARGADWHYSQPHDYMSERTLEYFARVAQRTPVIYIPAIEWTADDTTAIEIWISRNTHSLAAFRTILHGWNGFTDIFGLESRKFSVIMERVDNGYSEFAIAGLTQNYVNERDFLLAKAKLIPKFFGTTYVFQHRPILSDATGKSDLPVWALRFVQRSFNRSDFNQSFQVTVSDAAMASRYILKNIAPPLPHLGDANRNNLFDPDDPYIIFRQGLWGGGYGGGLGKMVGSSGSNDSVTKGVVVVEVR